MVTRLAVALLLVFAVGCHSAKRPDLRVLGMEARTGDVVYVQVTNPASRPMRLTKLQYRFASSGGSTVSQGEVALGEREVQPGAAIVVEIPLDVPASGDGVTLRGNLIAEQDHIIKSFKVSARLPSAK
ncbi:MAG TPA: hypothetical protein VK427_26060 [Kofleriaceae bacterium]|nr:hypothetical protein [Kofleriaceae bacterium]